MNIKPHNLKSFFNWIRKSPVDDIAFNAVKSNADNVARGALDVVDDIPSSISFDDIADTYNYRKNMPQPKSYDDLISNLKTDLSNKHDSRVMNGMFPGYGEIVSGADAPRFTDFTDIDVPQLSLDSIPDYSAMDIRPERFGQRKDLTASLDFPDGFTTPDDFARYYDALERGYLIRSDIPHYYYNPSLTADLFTKDRNAMVTGNLLSAQDALHLPISDSTREQSQMLAKKYLHPDNAYSYRPLSKNRMSELYKKLLNS